MKKNTQYLTKSAAIAALYVLLTLISHMFGLDSGVIQLRLSEALCLLPCITPAAVGGLFVGCLLSNILSGCALFDVIFGSIATLLGAVFTRRLKDCGYLAAIPPILANTLIIPPILAYVYGFEGGIRYFMLTVFAGEVVSCGIFGNILLSSLKKHKKFF